MTFRFSAKTIFLTYTHATFQPEELLDFIESISSIQKAICCKEDHQDGDTHLHATVRFQRTLETRDPRKFDFKDTHPHISTPRNWGRSVNYCRKDGSYDIVYRGCEETDIVATSTRARGKDGCDGKQVGILAQGSRSRLEFLQSALSGGYPYAYADAIWKEVRRPKPPTLEEDGDFEGVISCPVLQLRGWGPTDQTLVVCGPTGCGKTTWAKKFAPKPCLWVTHRDSLRYFDKSRHKSIIFDEVRFTGDPFSGRGKTPLEGQIQYLDWDNARSLHVRYGVAEIPEHVFKIFTCTDSICFSKDPQLVRRVKVVNCYPDKSDESLWLY